MVWKGYYLVYFLKQGTALLHSSGLQLANQILSNFRNKLETAMTWKLSNQLCKDLIKTSNLLQIYFRHPSNKIVQM